MTDSGGVLQEAHYAHTPYVFVLDIPKAPENTQFDVNRLVKPERQAILQKLNLPQQFNVGKTQKTQNMVAFEKNVMSILKEFGEK